MKVVEGLPGIVRTPVSISESVSATDIVLWPGCSEEG